jgi:HK97 family phage major capsid protein
VSASQSITRSRLERLVAERGHTDQKIEDMLKLAEDEQRDPNEFEREHLDRYRTRAQELETEIGALADELERGESSRDVSRLIRPAQAGPQPVQGPGADMEPTYRTFAQFARDELIVRYPLIATRAAAGGDVNALREQATERLQRVVNTTTSNIPGLLPPGYLAQIMDLINKNRPVVANSRTVPLTTGTLTYPRVTQRPEVLKQGAEKTEAGTANMQWALDTVTADTYLGAGDLSWQAINWASIDSLQVWFDLAAEAFARITETAACTELSTNGGGTIASKLSAAGTEDFNAWRTAIFAGIQSIYTSTGGRAQTDTLYLSASKFFQLASLGSANVLQLSSVGGLDVGSMTGTYAGLRVVGTFGFGTASAAIMGDQSAFLVGETPGAPVEMRVVEPNIGGMQLGVIGAFKAKVFDPARFVHIA